MNEDQPPEPPVMPTGTTGGRGCAAGPRSDHCADDRSVRIDRRARGRSADTFDDGRGSALGWTDHRLDAAEPGSPAQRSKRRERGHEPVAEVPVDLVPSHEADQLV